MIHQQVKKDSERLRSNTQSSNQYDLTIKAPCSVTCLSPVGVVYKISGIEFSRKVMKDPRSLKQMIENLANKMKNREEKMDRVTKQRLATDMDKFFGHEKKMRTLVDEDNLMEERKLLQKNIDERT